MDQVVGMVLGGGSGRWQRVFATLSQLISRIPRAATRSPKHTASQAAAARSVGVVEVRSVSTVRMEGPET